MNKPHIQKLPKEDVIKDIEWTCGLTGDMGFMSIGYGRTPVEAYRDFKGDVDVLEEVFGDE